MFTMRILESLRDQGVCSWAISDTNRYGFANVFTKWGDAVSVSEVDISAFYSISRFGHQYDGRYRDLRWGEVAIGGARVRMPLPVIERIESQVIRQCEDHYRNLSAHDRLSVIAMVDNFRQRNVRKEYVGPI